MIEKLMNIDRRIVFILVALAVIIPSLLSVSFPITVSQPTRSAHEYIEALPAGSTLMIGFNYGPSSLAELHPMAKAVIHHVFSEKNSSYWYDTSGRRGNVGRRNVAGNCCRSGSGLW